MADFLIQATLSNLVVATILAVIAWGVQRRVRSASLANLLWALVLIKMVTPPLFSLPVFQVPSVSSWSAGPAEVSSKPAPPMDRGAVPLNGNLTVAEKTEILTSDAPQQSTSPRYQAGMVTLAFAAWLVISTMLLLLSALRIIRFHWLLQANSRVHPELARLSADVARQLGLREHPNIVVTTANIAPFVWWMAGRSVIVVSRQATRKLNDKDLRLVISHEMAHIKRRDHWFRWLEWIALIGFWWNPVMWWARRQLRICEEVACDDLVLETAAPEVHQYANSLLNMAELLVAPAIRPPVVASAINSGGNLEKRLKMMIAEKTRKKIPSTLRMAIVAVAACVFPLGVVYAQDFDAVERRLGGAVEAGELSLEQANLMMEALRRFNTSRETEVKKRRYKEFSREIEAAVKTGKLSKEDAERKLIAVRREMFEETPADRTSREMEAKKRRYKEFSREIETAVKAGKLSKEDAERKLIAVRRELFEETPADGTDGEMEAKKRRYMEFAREIEAAVKAGKLSKNDAEKKLIAARREIFEEQPADRTNREMEARRKSYAEFEREIKSAVEQGEITSEEAEKKLIEKRKEMFGGND